MARRRIAAAAQKIAAAQTRRHVDEADEVAAGVHRVGKEIAPLVKPGSLYWTAPFQYVAEQMSVRVCREHGVPADRREDVAGYLLAAFNEYIVSLVGEFDIGHFEEWISAQDAGAE